MFVPGRSCFLARLLILLCSMTVAVSGSSDLASAQSVAGQSIPKGFVADGQSEVVSVTDGDTLRLADGREVRLIGIQAPKLPLGRPNYPTWPLAGEAKTALERLALKRTVLLYFGGARIDRNGRTLAQLVRDDGLWLQAEMLRLGMARVYSFPDNRTGVTALLAIEAAARQARSGLWSNPFYAIRTPETLNGLAGTYQLVEGMPLRVSDTKKALYLNFGQDWRQDFTVKLDATLLTHFLKSGVDLRRLEGKRVRVRGWLREAGGPLIDLTHPEQIERLED